VTADKSGTFIIDITLTDDVSTLSTTVQQKVDIQFVLADKN